MIFLKINNTFLLTCSVCFWIQVLECSCALKIFVYFPSTEQKMLQWKNIRDLEDCSEPRHMNSVWSAEAGMTGKVVNPHTRFIQTSDSTSHYQLLILTFYLDILYRKTMHALIVWLLYQRKCFCVVWRFPLVICAFFLANKWLPVGTVLKFKW